MNKVSLVGLGKLGLPLATCFATKNIEVLGIDKNSNLIKNLKKGELPFYEPSLKEEFLKSHRLFEFCDSASPALFDTDVTIVLVNTQINDTYSSVNVENVFSRLASEYAKIDKERHLFVLSSTVMPGDISSKLIPLIEKTSGKKFQEDFGFVYIPDFVKLGTVFEDFRNPEFMIIGCNNDKDYEVAKNLYSRMLDSNTRISRLTLQEAEVAKMAFNAYYVCKLSFVNFLANICERMENVNVDNITNTIGHDKRINSGTAFFKGGIAFGGTCLPRDVNAFIQFAEMYDLDASHIKAASKINDFQTTNLVNRIRRTGAQHIGIVGLSFKPGSPVTIESASIKLIEQLLKDGYHIHVFDPLDEAIENTRQVFGNRVECHESHKDCVLATECSVYMHFGATYPELADFVPSHHIAIDCWRTLGDLPCDHLRLGVG